MSIINKEHSLELASTIKKQVEILTSYEQDIPQIEIDIVKENIRKLYDAISNFHIVENPLTDSIQIEAIDNEINSLLDEASHMFDEEKEKQIIEQETVLEEQAIEDKIEPEIPDEKTIAKVHEDIIEVEVEVEVEKKIEVEVKKPGPKAKNKNELKVKIESKESKNPIREKKVYVLDVEPDDIEEDDILQPSTIIKKPIKSLKQGIGINDKFMFINDLFEGNAKQYNKVIKQIDALTSLKEAHYLIADLKDENLWENDDESYRQFRNYIERRFA